MRIIYNNRWDAYTLTESSEDSSYPAENTQDIRLAKPWRTGTASAATIDLDAGTGITITADCAAIIEHNLGSAATLSIQASTAATFTPVALSANMTWRDGPIVVYFTAGTYRYWRINISDTSNPDGYYEIGRIMLSEYMQVDPSSMVEFPEEHIRNDRVAFSRSNQLYADEGVGWKQLHYRFEYASNSAKTLVETMWNANGKYTPLLIMNYNTTFTVIEPLYCSIVEDITFRHRKYDEWDYDLVLRECS